MKRSASHYTTYTLCGFMVSIIFCSSLSAQDPYGSKAANIAAGGGYFVEDTTKPPKRDENGVVHNYVGQGWLGDPIEGIFPIPKDANNNGIGDVFEANYLGIGDLIAYPTEAYQDRKPKISSDQITEATDPEKVIFVYWHPKASKDPNTGEFRGQLYANDFSTRFEVEWESPTGLIKRRYIIDEAHTKPTVNLFLTDDRNNPAPPVDLTPQLTGSPTVNANIRLNSQVIISATTNHVWVDAQKKIHADKDGYVVLDYNIETGDDAGMLAGMEIIHLRELIDGTPASVQLGHQLLPSLPESFLPSPTDPSTECIPEITSGKDEYVFQHQNEAGSTKWKIFATKPSPTAKNNAIVVYWYKKSQNVCWHSERKLYRSILPEKPQINLWADEKPLVDMSTHESVMIKWAADEGLNDFEDFENHVSESNETGQYIFRGPGWSTFMYKNNAESGGIEYSFEIVRTVDHHDLNFNFPYVLDWDIGDRIVDESHDFSCNDGLVYSATNYDPIIYDRNSLRGPIFAVNTGANEIWWYEKSKNVCWPFKPVIYNCDWPETPNRVIMISNQLGAWMRDGDGNIVKDYSDTKYEGKHVYELGTIDGEREEIGDNPNEEHAVFVTDKLFAARDDINVIHKRSEPYVLVKFQDGEREKEWEFDVVKVMRDGSKSVPGFECAVGETDPCTFDYYLYAGQPVKPVLPLGGESDKFPRTQTYKMDEFTPSAFIWNDKRGSNWFIKGGEDPIEYGEGAERETITAEFYEDFNSQGPVAWLDDNTGDPIDVRYHVAWPSIPADGQNYNRQDEGVYTPLYFGETQDLRGTYRVEIVYDEGTNAKLIAPFKETIGDTQLDKPSDWIQRFNELPEHLKKRFGYDDTNRILTFCGVKDEDKKPVKEMLGIMSLKDLEIIEKVFKGQNEEHINLRAAALELYGLTQQAGYSIISATVDSELEGWQPNWGAALTTGDAIDTGYIVLGYNGDPEIAKIDPGVKPSVEVFRIMDEPFQGEVQVITSDCPFDEQIVLRWTGDCGGDCSDLEFWWQWHMGPMPEDFEELVESATPEESINLWFTPEDYPAPVGNPWSNYDDEEHGIGWISGLNEIVISRDNPNKLMLLTDNYFRVKVRVAPEDNGKALPAGTESKWTEPKLAEGWLKRVKKNLNTFDQILNNFRKNDVNTQVSMIQQLGPPYKGGVPLSCNSETINGYGLIELYEAVLQRGKSFTINVDTDVDAANQALMLIAGTLVDYYMLLGNEAYADAQDPTLQIDIDVTVPAYAIFSFQGIVPTLIDEEMALLRGLDDRFTISKENIYNRLVHNFYGGDGQVAYVNNYNIRDLDNDGELTKDDAGKISQSDAEEMYPQGHGDAWGHYLTAIKYYYHLLKHRYFTWQNRIEQVEIGEDDFDVSFEHERRFARVAAARAKTGAEITNLTYREQYTEDPDQQWRGYPDPLDADRIVENKKTRNWGVTDWSRRAFMSAYFDWAVANSLLPAHDDDPEHDGTVKQVDRITVLELREIASNADSIQVQLDNADAGLNPLGLAKNVVPFDIDPKKIDEGSTHFEQIYERAVFAVNNAASVFGFAGELSNRLRKLEESVTDFQNEVAEREADFNNRLIEIFGYPYPESRDPITQNMYGINYPGPDLYFYDYIDIEDLIGIDLDQLKSEPLTVSFEEPIIDDSGAIVQQKTNPVTFNIVPGYGLIKPGDFRLKRKAPGEIQLARSDLLQAKFRLDRALLEYDNLLNDIDSQAQILQSFYNASDQEIQIQLKNLQQQQSLNSMIVASRQRQLDFRLQSRMATAIANALAEAIPTSLGFSNDPLAPLRSMVRLQGTVIAESFGTSADFESMKELRYSQQQQVLNSQSQIEIARIQKLQQAEREISSLERMLGSLNTLEVEIYGLQEAIRQASGRYQAAIQHGVRLLDDRQRFRQKTASLVSRYRYKDMAFRVFRNDALQKYRAQFDLAARYVYLTAKAYDYETNLLETDSQAGEEFLSSIVRERSIGLITGNQPQKGKRGLSDIMFRMYENFTTKLESELGFKNPQSETNRWSLRKGHFRISDGLKGDENWKKELDICRVDDLRNHDLFLRYCEPFWTQDSTEKEPAIVISFDTTIMPGQNVFGEKLSEMANDVYYSMTKYTTKIRSVGAWFSNYNNTNLPDTPRVYLVPVGSDYMRKPTSTRQGVGKPRKWFILEQILPFPNKLTEDDLTDNTNWLPILDNFDSENSEFAQIRRFGDFLAHHDSGYINQSDITTESRLIGRSVWNTEWLFIIPGISLSSNRDAGLDRFIYGSGSPDNIIPGEGVSDILLYFDTYAY